MKKLIEWIKHHQVVAFYILTYAITWGLGFSYGGFYKQGQFLLAASGFYSNLRSRAGRDHHYGGNKHATQAREAQSILDRLLRGVGRVCARFYCPHHIIQSHSINPRVDRFYLCCGGTSCLRDQHDLFTHPGSKKLPVLVDPAAPRVGLVSFGIGVDPGFDPAFSSHQQPPRQAAHHSPPVPRCRPGTDRLGHGQIPLPVLLFQCHRGRGRLAWICNAQTANSYQSYDRSPDHGFFLGAVALFLMAGRREASLDLAILDRGVSNPYPVFGVHCMDLQSRQREHPCSRYHPRCRQYRDRVFPQSGL